MAFPSCEHLVQSFIFYLNLIPFWRINAIEFSGVPFVKRFLSKTITNFDFVTKRIKLFGKILVPKVSGFDFAFHNLHLSPAYLLTQATSGIFADQPAEQISVNDIPIEASHIAIVRAGEVIGIETVGCNVRARNRHNLAGIRTD